MKNAEFMAGLTRNMSRAGLQIKKHSPGILLATGLIGVVASAVMACKATTKVNDILEETKVNVDKVHQVVADETIPEETYSKEDAKKDLAVIYVKTGVEFAKLYGPSIAIGAMSIASILASHNIMHKRNVAITAAYAAVSSDFKGYRGRLIERFGKELDRELKHNIKAQTIEETVTDEKGKEQVVKKTVNVVDVDDPNTYSEYARFYDDGCLGWTKSAEDNLKFLKIQQSIASKQLQARGHLFLNDVYEMLGIPKTKAGQIVGWVYDERNPIGDNFVDFGIFNANRVTNRDFVNGYERVILLDFNVDGNILDLI